MSAGRRSGGLPEKEYRPSEMIVPEGWGFVRTLDRRDFLKLAGSGLLLAFSFAAPAKAWGQRWNPAGIEKPDTDFNAFLHIGVDGKVTVLVGKIEMGQGVMTSLPQLAAEELSVPLSSVEVVLGDTDLCPFDMGTFGSLSVRSLGPVLRAAAAEARSVLLQMASEKLKVPVSGLRVQEGVVSSKADPSRRVGYGELTSGKKIERHFDGKAALTAQATFKVMGTSPVRRDALEKVTGKARYAGDIAPEGVLHARILRPPAHGATLTSVDTAAAEGLPGVKVVRDGDLVAVLHAHRDEADKALKLVKAVFGAAEKTPSDKTIFDHLESTAPGARTVAEGGDLTQGEKGATGIVDQKYRKGYVAHAAMETHSAVAAVGKDGRITVWASTQTPFPLQTQVARALGFPLEKVRVITPYVGGGFGGKSASAQAIEAARLAVKVGNPVRVIWDRSEEFFFDTFDPACVLHVRAGLDPEKRIAFWSFEVTGSGERGAAHFYDIPHHRTAVRGGWRGGEGMHPFAIGPWRAPGASANAFARESTIDELARNAGADPVGFRLAHLKGNERMARTLQSVVEKAGWIPKPLPSKQGVGVALGEDAGTCVATVAYVTLDKESGAIQVKRVVCAQDMGMVVNPEGALQQLEGCVTMGLGYTLAEEIHFEEGVIQERNFPTYRIPRFSWVPKIEGFILSSPELPPQGGGEPAIVTVGAAVANAVFDATGARMTRLPMTAERVKEALPT